LTGREHELTRLDDLLAATERSVVIAAISGGPGVGKTALAVHWAHRVAAHFPDGQLFVNLRTTEPAYAIRGFLEAFGTTGDPSAALYRSTLAGRRVLIVLDDARDAGQVRPLLPGTPGCLVVVTSREPLTGLVAAEGAHPMRLTARDGTPDER
jgi:predicted ATPase